MSKNIPISGAGATEDANGAYSMQPATQPSMAPANEVPLAPAQKEDAQRKAVDPVQVETPAATAVKGAKQRKPTNRDLAAHTEYKTQYVEPSRKPASERPASFNPLAWAADGLTGAIEEVRHNDLGLSQDFWRHLYAVRRESLLTAQALVESLLAKVEGKSEELEGRKQRRERRGSVNIDF